MLKASIDPHQWQPNIISKTAFSKSRSGMAAVEFAIILPFLVSILLAGFETSRYINTSRKLTLTAYAIANMIATRTQAASLNDVIFAMNAAMIDFPQALSDANRAGAVWYQNMPIAISSVSFTPTVNGCTSVCTYSAKVDWSLSSSGTTSRSCSVAPTSTADTSASSSTSLPVDLFTSGSLIVVDLVFPYTPIFGTTFFKAFSLHRSAYIQPRYVTKISLSGAGNCP